jgi:hypothetical protein
VFSLQIKRNVGLFTNNGWGNKHKILKKHLFLGYICKAYEPVTVVSGKELSTSRTIAVLSVI